MSDETHPIFGKVWRSEFDKRFNTGFSNFENSTLGGVVRIGERRVDILAVVAKRDGAGAFRDLIAQCKKEFDRIGVLLVWNPIVESALFRYGFKRGRRGGEEGMFWRKDNETQ